MDAPIVALTTMQDTIRRAVEKFPEERSRIERAAAMIALGHVERLSVDVWAVKSQTRADHEYMLTGGTWRDRAGACQCVDKQRRPNHSCKHEWAVDLIQVAEERQRRIDREARLAILTDAERKRLAAWKRRYEAVKQA